MKGTTLLLLLTLAGCTHRSDPAIALQQREVERRVDDSLWPHVVFQSDGKTILDTPLTNKVDYICDLNDRFRKEYVEQNQRISALHREIESLKAQLAACTNK